MGRTRKYVLKPRSNTMLQGLPTLLEVGQRDRLRAFVR